MRCQWVLSENYWQGDRTVSRCTANAEVMIRENVVMLNGHYCKVHYLESKKQERHLKKYEERK